MAKVKITETVLRDAHQSLIATRMTMDEMLPMLSAMDDVGFYSAEVWGGATFDACLRFLNEDPWDRLRTIRKHMPNTKLQMLFRGQNMLGYRHYADDVLEYFVQKSVDNGIDILRIFDALNDIRNLEGSIKAAKKMGAHVQGAISYTTGPVFTTEYFVKYAKQLEDTGADSICIKDMAALITPYGAYELVSALKKAVKIPIQMHSHYTSGLASMAHLKAIEAGVDVLDTAMSPLALGTSHPATETMVAALAGTEYDTGLDQKKLNIVRAHVAKLRDKYLESGQLVPKLLGVDANTLLYQVPGGMLSNLVSQLAQAGKSDLLDDVLNEVPRVREESGYPPLVTPTSQIVGTQAVFNIVNGERYKMVTKEFRGMVRGEYGRTPVPIDPAFRKKIIGDDQPIDCRPADLIAPELEKLRSELPAKFNEQEEDVLSYAMFDKVATKFFENRLAKKEGKLPEAPVTPSAPAPAPTPVAAPAPATAMARSFNVAVNGKNYAVEVVEGSGTSVAPPAPVAVAAPAPVSAPAPAPAPVVGGTKVECPMPGTILDVKVTVGQAVQQGDVVAVLEAMKMENDISAPTGGKILSVEVKKGDTVTTGALLVVIG